MRYLVAPRFETSFTLQEQLFKNVTVKSKDCHVNIDHLLRQESFAPCIAVMKLLSDFAPNKLFTVWIRSDLGFRAFARDQHMVIGVGSAFNWPNDLSECTVGKQNEVINSFAHEATHLAIHGRQSAGVPVHREEFEACQWAAWFAGQDLMRDQDANYIGQKIDMGYRRSLRRVDVRSFSAAKWEWSATPPETMSDLRRVNICSDGWDDWSKDVFRHSVAG